jgi:hypothetical protein
MESMKPGDDLDDLRDLVHEHHDGVVDGEDRRDETGAGNEHRDELRDRLLHDHVDHKVRDPADDHVLKVGEVFLDLVPRGSRTLCHERHHHVEADFERLDDRLAQHLDELLANVLPRQAQHGKDELDDL